jgi:hypothetical protein
MITSSGTTGTSPFALKNFRKVTRECRASSYAKHTSRNSLDPALDKYLETSGELRD